MDIFSNEEDQNNKKQPETVEMDTYSYTNKPIVDENALIQNNEYTAFDFGKDEIQTSTGKSLTKYQMSDFDLLKVLGRGGYGKVFLAKIKNSKLPEHKSYFALKELKKAVLICNLKDIVHTMAERNILEIIAHPFIVNCAGAFQTNNKLYLVLEYLPGGELFSQLEKNIRLPEFTARFYLSEIALAISHLHDVGVVYRDLKPENIMLDREGHVKLTDFGLSKESVDDHLKTHTFCGTIEYMAPEVITRTGHGPTADWWSFGILMYDMLAGRPPFSTKHRKLTMDAILNGSLVIQPHFTYEASDLIKKLLRRNPENRIGYGFHGFKLIKDHRFFAPVNWEMVYHKQIPPPFRPKINSMDDTANFDPTFTNEPVANTPGDAISSSKNDLFKGFSYANDSFFNRN